VGHALVLQRFANRVLPGAAGRGCVNGDCSSRPKRSVDGEGPNGGGNEGKERELHVSALALEVMCGDVAELLCLPQRLGEKPDSSVLSARPWFCMKAPADSPLRLTTHTAACGLDVDMVCSIDSKAPLSST
jgi:hypothetical protein